MSGSVCRSTAWPGTNTAGACPTESCPMSTEAAPDTPGGGTCLPSCQHTWHQEPACARDTRACTLPCPELQNTGMNSLIGGWSKGEMKPVLQNGVGGGGCSSFLDKQLESLVLLLFLSGARLFKDWLGQPRSRS